MSYYKLEVYGIEIVCLDEQCAKIECFDEYCSSITISGGLHTVESWRELSAKIEEALLQIHPASTTRV